MSAELERLEQINKLGRQRLVAGTVESVLDGMMVASAAFVGWAAGQNFDGFTWKAVFALLVVMAFGRSFAAWTREDLTDQRRRLEHQ